MQVDSASSEAFTTTILKSVREQRHKAIRVIVATQEPTVNPALLDLCSMTFVHRFTSPLWFATLKKHLAGALFAAAAAAADASVPLSQGRGARHRSITAGSDDGSDGEEEEGADTVLAGGMGLFRKIVKLNVGESLLFCPTAALWVGEKGAVEKLWEGSVKFRTRPRVTADGGRSVMAKETAAKSSEDHAV
jgi:hypothetical protein